MGVKAEVELSRKRGGYRSEEFFVSYFFGTFIDFVFIESFILVVVVIQVVVVSK